MNAIKLIMVTENNNNKFYDMIPNGDGTFTAEYGRIDSTAQRKVYPMNKWDSIYFQKVKKGYRDVTMLHVDEQDTNAVAASPFNSILNRLQSFAKKFVSNSYSISSQSVTKAMIEEAQIIINDLVGLSRKSTKEEFNNTLIKLFNVLPRKMKKVQDYLLNEYNKEAINKIIAREQDTLDAMESVVSATSPKTDAKEVSLAEAFGLEMAEKDSDLEKQVKNMLGDISDKYVNCWYVKNIETQKRYDEYVAKQKGIHKTEQLFWHGSRNENWLSILKSGLMIRPAGVVVTGSMFGSQGLYFANRARKSYGYTSANGSYWARGNSNNAFLAIFKVNTGKHHNVYKHTSECYDFNKDNLKKKGNYDSVYAHKGADLRNDEFIVYDIAQATIYALVELKG